MTAELPTTEQRLATLEVRVAAIETKLLGLRKLTAAQATTNDRAPDSWTRIEDCLKRSVECWVFRGHEGCWVFARFLIVLALAGLAARGHYYLASAVALIPALEIVAYNTAVVFVTKRIENRLRSVVLTIFAFASLAVAVSPIWIWLRFAETEPVSTRLTTGIYQSVRTLTTAGPDSSCFSQQSTAAMQWIASIEMILGIYFVAVIIARYLSLKPKGEEHGETR